MLCKVVLTFESVDEMLVGPFAYMPTLPDYPGVSRIRNESPGLPYGSPHLPDKSDFGFYLYIWLIF